MRKFASLIMAVLLLMSAVGCQAQGPEENTAVETVAAIEQTSEIADTQDTWESTLEEAEGTTVTFYGWGGSQQTNAWLDNTVADYVLENYDVTLERVPMNIDEILNKLLGEKQLNAEGTIDVVWINGENFSTAKSGDLLYGPFTDLLPNFNQYLDGASREVQYDFGFATEGYEAPYGKAQFVLIADGSKTEFPKSHVELLELAKANPGQITYPALPDFTGSAFVRNIIYDVLGTETVENLGTDKEEIRQAIQPALDYLLELKPYLWMEGETYPATVAQLDNMYSDGEVILSMSYNPNHVASKIHTGEFSETSEAFVFESGTVGNTHFMAIPDNAVNKAGAKVVINAILSPELQASKYDPATWGDLPVLDNSKMSADEKALFEAIPLGQGVPTQEELLSKRVPEMPVHLVPIIEEIWMETVPGA
jgi:putative spermidine/putrescine transport system substrate-binding protein